MLSSRVNEMSELTLAPADLLGYQGLPSKGGNKELSQL